MTAASVTGIGTGEAGKLNSGELAMLANGPTIYLAGTTEATEISDGVFGGTVTFATPLPGDTGDPGNEYCVMLTTVDFSWASVTDLDDDDLDGDDVDDHFVGFSFSTAGVCDVMYLVVKKGVKPVVTNN